MNIEYHSNQFQEVKKVSWNDVISKINHDYELGPDNYKICYDNVNIPAVFAFSNFRPNSLGVAFDEVKSKYNVLNMHVYSSLAKNASNFGNHYDNTDVLIVQSVGIIKYSFDNNLEHTLYPGDSLFIPKYVNHNPIILEPRITLSFDFGS